MKMAEKWLVIDAHNHYIPEKAKALTREADGMDFTASVKRLPVGYRATSDNERRIALMDEAGVDMVVLEQSAWSPKVRHDNIFGRRATMRVTVCELNDEPKKFEKDWKSLVSHVKDEGSEFVLLPEMPFFPWPFWRRKRDPVIWREAVKIHEASKERLADLVPGR